MWGILRRVLLAFCALSLSACFESKQPLIKESDSVAPVRPGTYVSSYWLDSDNEFKITVSGGITNVTEIDTTGKAEVSTYLARPLRNGYFIVMRRSDFQYGLIHVEHQRVDSYSNWGVDHCTQLEELAFKKDVPLSKMGVADLQGNHCYFDTFASLIVAFGALVEANKMEVVATYSPKSTKSARVGAAHKDHNASNVGDGLMALQYQLSARGLAVESVLELIRNSYDQAAHQGFVREVHRDKPRENSE